MKKIIFTSIFIILLISCSKSDNDNDNQMLIDCANFRIALLNFDSEQLNIEVNKLTSDLAPSPDINDRIGHLKNLDILIERLNSECTDIIAAKECYACIETNPVQSEIKVKLDSFGIQIDRIIDINTSEADILKSVRVHPKL
ncbi:hypothetical protein POV26_13665 [Aequorivita todarodis]|uniref:hypothetical protein n=1 Tax=Aequorivita todarodis TaxID=2036821 RepID=UPI002350BB2D|nr:hypothetical protein [Aequorivita todarodis]MDC8002089.1 hypothetical protein [Aequorivita todarodis]